MRRLPLGLLFVLCAFIAFPIAQNPPQTGLLMGVVIDAADERPVPNAEVKLTGALPGAPASVVLADNDGRFVFMGLPKGSFTITATKPGYAEGAYGRLRPLGLTQVIALNENERLADLRVPLFKFATVTGRVTDEAGEPVVGVMVRILQRAIVAGREKLTPGVSIKTDDRGIYRIASLTPGEYAVAVPATQVTAPDSIIDLRTSRFQGPLSPQDTDFMRDISFSGGNDALVALENYRQTRVGMQSLASVSARGRAAVAPGRSGGGRIHLYPTQYHPAANTAATASTITLRSGEERVGVDIQLALAPTSLVSGTVRGPDGPSRAVLTLVPESDDFSSDTGFETATSMSDTTGKFTFIGVPEGRYRLRAILAQVPATGASRGAPPPPAPIDPTKPVPTPVPDLGGFTLSAMQTITVGSADVNDLALTLRPGHRFAGRAQFEGARAQPTPDLVRRMSATFDPADARPLLGTTIFRGQFDERGRLLSYQVPPGRYYVRINNPPAGWSLKSAMFAGADVSNVPLSLDADATSLVVTFTDRPASLSGRVQNAAGAVDTAATVLVLPSDSTGWMDYGAFPRRMRAIRVDREGQYRTDGLPAGEYLVVAVRDEVTANWQDPRVLRVLAKQATAVTIAEGEARTVSLRTSAVPR